MPPDEASALQVQKQLEGLLTEKRNMPAKDLSKLPVETIVDLINLEDQKVARAVRREIPQIVRAVNAVINSLKKGGRLLYVGAGTSGRLGVMDAAELLPTFGVGSEMVQAIIAGGRKAMFRPAEGAEDDVKAGARILQQRMLSKKDVVLGISASGRTPFVIGALDYARNKIGSKTIALTVNPKSPIWKAADITICPVTGPEVLAGSTRMKAGTAQKMVLNMLSTATMTKLGRVYGNLMVDLKPFSRKLVERTKRMVIAETGLSYNEAERLLKKTKMNTKLALLISKTSLSESEGRKLLLRSHGSLDKAIEFNRKTHDKLLVRKKTLKRTELRHMLQKASNL